MRKIYTIGLLLFVILLVTGCEVNYNLDFSGDSLKENITVSLSGNDFTPDNIDKMKYSAEYEAYAISRRTIHEKYNFTYEDKRDEFIGKFNYDYTVDNFNDAHLIRECYDSFNFVKTDSGYSLVTSDTFKCLVYSYLPVNKYTITITSDRVVTGHNADKIDGNKYIWIMNSNGDSLIKKPIKIDFSNETLKDKNLSELSNKSGTVLIIIGIGVLSILAITVIVFIVKSQKNQD